MTEYANILDRITEGRDLPDGCDRWGLKATDFAGRTRGGFRWPDHGWVESASPDPANTDACPIREGDGVCVGLTFVGIASGGHRALALLLVAFASDDALSSLAHGYGLDKVRVRRAFVVERLDGEGVVKAHGAGAGLRRADLRGADLRGAYLDGADLRGAYLDGADLRGAYLDGANLYGANLRGANLYGANLYGANLRGANLRGADLYGANLDGADLYGANLYGANLDGADLDGADLYGANLYGANLDGADLYGANLYGANHDEFTRWPEGFTPPGGAA